MSHGKRPGGLTAMAVINFVFGGLGALGLFFFIILFAIIGGVVEGEVQEEMKKGLDEAGITAGFLVFLLVVQATVVGLLITSGVGYLKQKKALGRYIGTTYALVSIGSNLLSGLLMPVDSGGGFNLGTIIGLIYPVLTLILLNTTFKEDLVN